MNAEPTTPTTPRSPVVRNFATSSHGSMFIQKDDLVLIITPEDFEIQGCVDPMLSGKMGYVVSEDTENLEVTVRLKKKRFEPAEYVVVPRFCLCLEDEILSTRVEKKKTLDRCGKRREQEFDFTQGGSSPSMMRFAGFMQRAR